MSQLERAQAGKCIICNRRLPKRKIALYTALVTSWDRTRGDDQRDVEVAVCGEACLSKYNHGVLTI